SHRDPSLDGGGAPARGIGTAQTWAPPWRRGCASRRGVLPRAAALRRLPPLRTGARDGGRPIHRALLPDRAAPGRTAPPGGAAPAQSTPDRSHPAAVHGTV